MAGFKIWGLFATGETGTPPPRHIGAQTRARRTSGKPAGLACSKVGRPGGRPDGGRGTGRGTGPSASEPPHDKAPDPDGGKVIVIAPRRCVRYAGFCLGG